METDEFVLFFLINLCNSRRLLFRQGSHLRQSNFHHLTLTLHLTWAMSSTSISLRVHWQFNSSWVTQTSGLWYITRTMCLQEVTVRECVCCPLAYLIVTPIHFSVKTSLDFLFSFLLVIFFVLVLLYQAFFPDAKNTWQHHAQTDDAKGGCSPGWFYKITNIKCMGENNNAFASGPVW